nr:flagellar protein FlaG [Oceanococcus sp. HetDA_MAG_MS8]
MEINNVSNVVQNASANAEAVQRMRPVPPVQPPARVDNDGLSGSNTRSGSAQAMPQTAMSSGDLEFRLDEGTDRMVVSIFDNQGELVRQIPAEVVLRLAERIDQILTERSFGLDREA